MTRHRTKLWLGIGSFLLAGTSTAALALGSGGVHANLGPEALTRAAASGVQIAAGGEGGEKGEHERHRSGGESGEKGRSGSGGEGGEAGTAPDDANVRFLTRLAMMEAHLDVAMKLFELGHHDMAVPHFSHPVAEIYDDIERDLDARAIPSFEHTLKELAEAGARKDRDKIRHEYAEAKDDIAKARATVHADAWRSPRVQMKVAIALLQAAARDYDGAVTDGKITSAEEFQDGWAFVYEAEKTVAAVADALKKSWPDAYGRVAEQLAALKRAWPDVMPPKRSTATTQDVHALVSRIELAASPVVN